ncbi:MAG: GntR family transcriptional regulator [Synergistetes bacterium]|nr:GntR family transcriptional regulator [Synergistota bacterium]MCX8127441.1 GntR family transcriptional regulator [Synergistota bacterium]MDW8192304.1 GntR family transcriptional regulator [Synergistota bacterium]
MRRKKTLGEKIYEKLKEEIISRKRKVGEKLVERDLAQIFKVSITPVRDALKKLEDEGLVTKRGKLRTVRGVNTRELEDYYEVRILLEPKAAEKAASRISEEGKRKLDDIIQRMEIAVKQEDYNALDLLNRELDETIYEACGNRYLQKVLQEVLAITLPYREIASRMPERIHTMLEEHKEICETIKSGEAKKAAELTEKHIKGAAERVLRVLKELEEII